MHILDSARKREKERRRVHTLFGDIDWLRSFQRFDAASQLKSIKDIFNFTSVFVRQAYQLISIYKMNSADIVFFWWGVYWEEPTVNILVSVRVVTKVKDGFNCFINRIQIYSAASI